MKLRTIITTAAITLLSLSTQAATIIVPAAGTGPGANSSHWQSELTLHTAAPRDATVSISLHQGTTVHGPIEVTLQARETISIQDIARTRFGLTAGTGALVIEASDRVAKSLVVTSRTFNVSADGEFGQDIPAVNAVSAAGAGDIAALTGPSLAGVNRFNFGVYAVETSTIRWEVVRADGTAAGSKEVTYAAGEHNQYSRGIATLIGIDEQDNDTVHARVLSGKAIAYGSIVNATGDPSFVPGVRTRDDILIEFLGVDLNENGTVDLFDGDGDGVLDAPIQVKTSLYPSYFRVMAQGEFGEVVTLEIVSCPADAVLLDADTVRVIAMGGLGNTTGELVIRATSGHSSTLLRIPLLFK